MIEVLFSPEAEMGYDGCCALTCHDDGCNCQDVNTGTCYTD